MRARRDRLTPDERVADRGTRDKDKARAADRARYERDKPKRRAANRDYVARNREQENARRAEWNRQNPEKKWAHKAVAQAKARGELVPQPCEVCGAQMTHAHHDDYARPLDVRWLCPTHHAQANR